jgi:hypothetical protein
VLGCGVRYDDVCDPPPPPKYADTWLKPSSWDSLPWCAVMGRSADGPLWMPSPRPPCAGGRSLRGAPLKGAPSLHTAFRSVLRVYPIACRSYKPGSALLAVTLRRGGTKRRVSYRPDRFMPRSPCSSGEGRGSRQSGWREHLASPVRRIDGRTTAGSIRRSCTRPSAARAGRSQAFVRMQRRHVMHAWGSPQPAPGSTYVPYDARDAAANACAYSARRRLSSSRARPSEGKID